MKRFSLTIMSDEYENVVDNIREKLIELGCIDDDISFEGDEDGKHLFGLIDTPTNVLSFNIPITINLSEFGEVDDDNDDDDYDDD